jgi:hypothetical protein
MSHSSAVLYIDSVILVNEGINKKGQNGQANRTWTKTVASASARVYIIITRRHHTTCEFRGLHNW